MRPADLYRLAAIFETAARKFAKDHPSGGYLVFCNDDETVLLIKRSKQMSSPGTWDIPGGRYSKKDDTVEDTAAREVREELDSLPENKQLLGKHVLKANEDHHNEYVIFIFAVSAKEKQAWTKKIHIDDESDAFKWFKYDELPENTHFDLRWAKEKINALK